MIYLNGKFILEDQATISVKDRSYLYGEGLFETLRATQSEFPFFKEHWERLQKGIQLLGIRFKFQAREIYSVLKETLRRNQLSTAYVRLTLSRMNRELGSFDISDATNLMIVAKPLLLKEKLESISALISQNFYLSKSELNACKTTSYLPYLIAKQEAQGQGYEEAILLNSQGRVVEGATSNLFMHDGKRWVTPLKTEGALPGVTRGVLLEIMKREGIPFSEETITLERLSSFQEILFTNSIRGVVSLNQIKNHWQAGKALSNRERTQEIKKLWEQEVLLRLQSGQSNPE